MLKKSREVLIVERSIKAFLRLYRPISHLERMDLYYWNESDVQRDLCKHLKERMPSEWVHAEGYIEIPRYAHWGGPRRADIVIINHSDYKKWFREETKYIPPYEAMIELKVIWPGQGRVATEAQIRDISITRKIKV
ncbi:MAG: hypothetical protein HXX80_00380 [Nitrososphaerales archaeon]|nr:hypothetical protein [Nitrososphaerales archaeon]